MLYRIATALAIAVALIGITEWFLSADRSGQDTEQPNYRRLAKAHAPYSVKHPHPTFGFFLPESSTLDTPSNNSGDIVRVSQSGFRGAAPEDANDRPLAFLVGNSVVFGFAPNDSLTITGYLNRIQNAFFFVNAGVPSWVSSQMRRRVVVELLAYNPALVVFWGGHNDASLAYATFQAGQQYDPTLIEQPSRFDNGAQGLLRALLPNLTLRLERFLTARHHNSPNSDGRDVARAAADAFIANVDEAYAATSRSGACFLAIYQPILLHHANRPPEVIKEGRRLFFEHFHERVLDQADVAGIPILDLANVFDPYFTTVPVFTKNVGPDLDEQVFVDGVHLYIPGNHLVARIIAAKLSTAPGGSSGYRN